MHALGPPDFSPIEQAFSKLKTRLHRPNPRTREALWAAIRVGIGQITPSDATGSFRHCSYDTSLQYFWNEDRTGPRL